MAHTASARKRIRQNEKKNEANKSYKSRMRTMIKKFIASLESKNNSEMEAAFQDAVSTIAKTASKGVIHKNQASRRIARLADKLNKSKTAA